MRFNRLDLNLLVVLDALLAERHITRAGEKLHLSQSATSSALARLREYFGDELLVQVGRKMVPTPLGESLGRRVRNVLVEVEATIEHRPEFDPASADRKFVLLMSDYTATVLMPAVIRQVAREAPGVSLEVVPPTDAPLEEMERGAADFLLMPRNFLSDQHPFRILFPEDFVCVGDRELALPGESISLDQYLRMDHVIVRFGQQRRPAVDEWLIKRYGIERRAAVIAPSFSAVPQYLVGTARIATLHRRLALQWADWLPLKIVPTPIEIPSVEWGIQWHRHRDLDPATIWLRELIVGAAEGMDAPEQAGKSG